MLVLVGVGVVGFMLYGLLFGNNVTVSGVLLTIVVFFGLGIVLFLLKGAQRGKLELDDFVVLATASAGVFGLSFLITKFNPGSFSILDQPLQETFISNIMGFPLWLVVVVAGLIYFLRKPNMRRRLGL